MSSCGAEVLVNNLKAQGVTHIFGIPGAKVDRVFDVLINSGIELIVCRHEQNSAFIAAGLGHLTGKAGVCIATSGPGCTNLVTGFATANSEGLPLVGFGGSVPRAELLKQTHQSLDTVSLFRPVTRYSVEIDAQEEIGEVVANAFRSAESGRGGAAYVSLPMDVMAEEADNKILTPVSAPRLGAAFEDSILQAANLINKSQRPVLLLGMLASRTENAMAIRLLLSKTPLPSICTYQGAGVISKDLLACFAGRVGLFHNQPGDRLLDEADLVVTVGYNPIEYDPKLWNKGQERPIVHIDELPASIDNNYKPTIELIGNIGSTLNQLTKYIDSQNRVTGFKELGLVRSELEEIRLKGKNMNGFPIHPLKIISELQPLITEDVTLALDMGSFHIWHARYLYSFRPQQVMVSNGQQTLGVGLTWAIAACIARPSHKAISVSGDGGFLFSAMELETAVRLKCNLVHIIWNDGSYNMVAFQEQMKYGRTSGVDFGPVDFVKYAEAFGAKGFRVNKAEDIAPIFKKAMELDGPVLIDIPVDYSDNIKLGEMMHKNIIL